jgi:hypothetical protein
MSRFTLGAGVAIVMVLLTGCSSGDSTEPPGTATAPETETEAATPSEPSPNGAAPDDVCALYDGIDRDLLIGTAAGDLNASDDECSFGAAEPGQIAQSSISLGAAPAIEVFRTTYAGPPYDCDVVDVSGLGDDAFSCFGGDASSNVVFAMGDVLVIFSAGNTSAGPPTDSIMLDAAQRISENLTP